jgi:allophanate hydrolase
MSTRPADGEIAIAVVGAHLSGMPLNEELKSFGARYLERTTTASSYRLFALADCAPPKPGLMRIGAEDGAAIEIEIWALPAEKFGRFVAAVPPPLAIGTLEVADGREVKGFLVEAEATRGARDISAFGGWRAFLEQLKQPT